MASTEDNGALNDYKKQILSQINIYNEIDHPELEEFRQRLLDQDRKKREEQERIRAEKIEYASQCDVEEYKKIMDAYQKENKVWEMLQIAEKRKDWSRLIDIHCAEFERYGGDDEMETALRVADSHGFHEKCYELLDRFEQSYSDIHKVRAL